MGTDERNFRSSYYEKVGCYSVEEKKSLNKLLQDNIRNHPKLKQFCLSYTVPTDQRILLWSIILGVMPLHKNSTEYILEQLAIIYDDLLRAVTVMQYVDANTPKHRVMHAMWLLENNRLLYPSVGAKEDAKNFMEIVKVLLEIFDSDVETFWIATEFYKYTKAIGKECAKLKELTTKELKRDDLILYTHLESLDIFKANDLLDKWYSVCFADVISESSLVKVWDKICGGSRRIVIFVFLELVKTLRESILKCKTQKDFKKLIEQVKEQDAIIVNKAIKNWQSNNSHSEITVH